MLWIFFLIMSTLLAATAIAVVLPRLVLRVRTAGYVCRDRGVRRLNTPSGSAIVCEPAYLHRGALLQYCLARQKNGVLFVGKWAKDVICAEYDLYVYDCRGKILRLLSVRELPRAGRGERISLPQDTGFVSPALRSVNGEAQPSSRGVGPQLLYGALLVLFLAAAVTAEALFCDLAFSHLLAEGGFFFPQGSASFLTDIFFLSAAVLLVAVFSLFGAKQLFAYLRGRRRSPRAAKRSVLRRARLALGNLFYRVRNGIVSLGSCRAALALRKKWRAFRRAAGERLKPLREKFRRLEREKKTEATPPSEAASAETEGGAPAQQAQQTEQSQQAAPERQAADPQAAEENGEER